MNEGLHPVTAVVVNWNRPEDTLRCLASLERSLAPLSVVVVDNGSSSSVTDCFKTRYPDIEVLCLDTNRGFAAGANVGIQHALSQKAAAVLLINDDAEVQADTLQHLIEAARPADVAAAGAKILVAGQPHLLWSAGEQSPKREPVTDDGRFDQDRDVLYATGCCLLLKAEAIDAVGLFDEAFFALFEEVDWCRRARIEGWRIRYAHRAIAHHHLGSSLGGGLSPTYHYLNTRNWLRFEEKGSSGLGTVARVIAVARVWWHEIKLVLRRGPNRLQRGRAVTLGARDFLRKRWGAPPGFE